MFLDLKERIMFMKMKKPRKKKSSAPSWKGSFLFVKYFDGNGFMD
jgi:hypothetical protein